MFWMVVVLYLIKTLKQKGVFGLADKTREELREQSRENIEYIIEYMKKRLQMVNTAAISSESFDTDQYEDLLDLYDFLNKKDHFTLKETETIVSELGQLRKR